MAKKSNKSAETANASETSAANASIPHAATNKLHTVKGIKNTLFADLEIGEVVTIAGVIRGIQTKTGTYGDYTQFKGEFGLKTHKGEYYKAGTMYLPEVAADVLKNGFITATEENEGKLNASFPKVEFKFNLSKVTDPDPRNARGYKWQVETLLESQPESDKVLALLG